MADELPIYGIHHRMLVRGRFGADGGMISHPQDPVWNLLHVRGPLETDLLAEAVARVTAATDTLHLRLRRDAAGPAVEWREPVPWQLERHAPAGLWDQGRLDRRTAKVIADVLFTRPDLRTDPAGRFVLVPGAADEHLLAVTIDHSVADGWALGLILRRVGLVYRALAAGDTVAADRRARGPRFADFLRSLPAADVQAAAMTQWTADLARFAVPGPPFRQPGGRAKEPSAYRITATYETSLPAAAVRDLDAAALALGVTRPQILTGLATALATRWSDGPQPVIWIRHGRYRRSDIGVVGPLMESCVAVPPTGELPAPQWFAEFCRLNANPPALSGLSLRDAGLLAPRHVAVNVVPPSRPLALGTRTVAYPLTGDVVSPMWPDGPAEIGSDAALWLNFYLDAGDDVGVLLEYDADVIVDPAAVIATLGRLLVAAAGRSEF